MKEMSVKPDNAVDKIVLLMINVFLEGFRIGYENPIRKGGIISRMAIWTKSKKIAGI